MKAMSTSSANDCTTALNATPTTTATARSRTLPRMMNSLNSFKNRRMAAKLLRRADAELGPVLGITFGVLAEHPPVDRVEFDEPADAGRFVGAVEQDPPF